LGTSIIRPSSGPADVTVSWSQHDPDFIAEAVRSAQVSSSLKMEEDAAQPDPWRLDYGSGFRASVRELRESVREAASSLTAGAPAKIEKQQARSAARSM
jgi:hypothetical protein